MPQGIGNGTLSIVCHPSSVLHHIFSARVSHCSPVANASHSPRAAKMSSGSLPYVHTLAAINMSANRFILVPLRIDCPRRNGRLTILDCNLSASRNETLVQWQRRLCQAMTTASLAHLIDQDNRG